MNKMYRILILLMLIVSSLFVLNACKKPAAIPGSGDGNKQEEHVHSFGNPVVIEADCTKSGSEIRSCECGETNTITIPPLGHEAGETVVVAQRDPTCQLEGYLETEIICSRCGYGFDSEIIEYEKIQHDTTLREEIVVQTTCSHPGVKQVFEICESCGDCLYTYTEAINKLDHTPGPTVRQDVVKVGCLQDGLYYNNQYCSVCNSICSSTEVKIPATGHNPDKTVVENYVAPDCFNQGGYDNVVYCKTCTSVISADHVVLGALSHVPGDEVKENIKSQFEYELVTYCTLCGHETSRVFMTFDSIEHTPGKTVTNTLTQASCSAEGSEEVIVYCADCGYAISRTVNTIPKLEHTSRVSKRIVITPATCTESGMGLQYMMCKVCREDLDIQAYIIEATGHSYSADQIETLAEITCTTPGRFRTYSTCSGCGDTKYGAEYESEAYGHKTITKRKEWLDATCTTDGYIIYATTCQRCNEELSTQTVINAASGHSAGTSVKENIIESTCAETGSYDTVRYCRGCSIEMSRTTTTTAKKAHTKSELVVQNYVETSCTAPGSYDEVIYCTVCLQDITRTTYTIDQLPHEYVVANCKNCGVEAEYKYPGHLELTDDGTGYILQRSVNTSNQEIVYATSYNGIPIVEIQGINTANTTVKIVIGKHVKTISGSAFTSTGVQIFEIQEGNEFFIVKEDGNLYSADGKDLVRITSSESNKTIVIDSSLRSFYEGAFRGNNCIESVTINSCADSFVSRIFYNCTSLKEVTINIDTDIPSSAFDRCTALEVVNIGGNVKVINDNAFSRCTSLKTINYAGNFEKIGYEAFYNCTLLEEFPFGEKISYVGSRAFLASGIKRVELKHPVEIGESVFVSCSSLEYADIRGATVIGENLFYNCNNLKFAFLGSDLAELPMWVFRECRSFTDLVILNPEIHVDSHAFTGNTDVEVVYFGGNAEQWNNIVRGDSTVYGLTGVDYVYYYYETRPLMPGNCWHLVDGEVTIWPELQEGEGSRGLKYQINPDNESYSVIGFGTCTDDTVVIPDTYNDLPVTKISRLGKIIGYNPTTIIIPDSVTEIDEGAFQGCRVKKIVLPRDLDTIKADTFKDCIYLEEIYIGFMVYKISDSAFSGCTSLTTIYYGGGRYEWEDYGFDRLFDDSVTVHFGRVETNH